jgi:type IV pilus assembly protein PilA
MKHPIPAGSGGFTLLELLVVMGIISGLIMVAVPKYGAYRAKAFDTRAEVDLRSVAMAEEAYFLDQDKYLACANQSCTSLPGISRLSPGVTVNVALVGQVGFRATASHPKGTGKVFTWDSQQGGIMP